MLNFCKQWHVVREMYSIRKKANGINKLTNGLDCGFYAPQALCSLTAFWYMCMIKVGMMLLV